MAEVVALEAVRDEGLEHVVLWGGGGVVCEEALVDEFVDLAGWGAEGWLAAVFERDVVAAGAAHVITAPSPLSPPSRGKR